MRDKLLCGTSGTTGLAHIPFVSLLDELLTVGIQPLSLCQRPDDLRIQLLIRRVKRNRQSEAVCQRLTLLNTVLSENFSVLRISVSPRLLDEISPVRSHIDEDILRLHFHTAFQHGFEMFVFDFGRFKRQIVDKNDKTAARMIGIPTNKTKLRIAGKRKQYAAILSFLFFLIL